VELSSGATSFRSTVVKPYFQLEPEIREPSGTNTAKESSQLESGTKEPSEINLETGDSNTIEVEIPTPQPQTGPKRQRGRPRKYPVLTGLADIEIYLQYDTSRQKELNGLLEKGVFEICNLSDIP
jgi:hypothetical protein